MRFPQLTSQRGAGIIYLAYVVTNKVNFSMVKLLIFDFVHNTLKSVY